MNVFSSPDGTLTTCSISCQIISVFSLYIWCAAADPADLGVFKSKKYLKIPENGKHNRPMESKLGGESTSSINDANAATTGQKPLEEDALGMTATTGNLTSETNRKSMSSNHPSWFMGILAFFPCAFFRNCSTSHEESSEQQMSEDGMFYCSLCEVEVSGSICD